MTDEAFVAFISQFLTSLGLSPKEAFIIQMNGEEYAVSRVGVVDVEGILTIMVLGLRPSVLIKMFDVDAACAQERLSALRHIDLPAEFEGVRVEVGEDCPEDESFDADIL